MQRVLGRDLDRSSTELAIKGHVRQRLKVPDCLSSTPHS
jgi:hypothetical protein